MLAHSLSVYVLYLLLFRVLIFSFKVNGICRLAINWAGGWHHAQRDEVFLSEQNERGRKNGE